MVHLFVDSRLPADFGRFAATRLAFVTPTLTVLSAIVGEPSGKDLPADTRLAPYLSPADLTALRSSFNFRQSRPKLEYAEEAVRRLQAAGVPILAGTDSS